ncbi:MAG: phosphate signaling complex protein PhoU [Eubacteriales bacterium]|jgi:phosphate transport system protein|nr:phosphate signaling complex protein PhoU [Eubacteriales bacterium]
MRNRFDAQLEMLNNSLIAMGALCENAIASAVKALMNNDMTLVSAVIAAEAEIDQKEKDIESLCLKLLLQQQPVARDLRLISAALKMITDMERIGDQAADISEIVSYIDLSGSINKIHISDMAQAAIKMVTDSIDAFVKRDLKLAEQVIKHDDVVDDLFSKIKSDVVSLITNNPKDGEQFVDLIMIAKYLERIGDHATNIAEWVVFSITGEHKEA